MVTSASFGGLISGVECGHMTLRIPRLACIVTLCGGLSMLCAAQSEQPQRQPGSATQSEQTPSDPPSKPKAKHVYTNDDIPPSPDASKPVKNNPPVMSPEGAKISAAQIREMVRKQKARLAEAQAARDRVKKLADKLPKTDCRRQYPRKDAARDVCDNVPERLKQAQSRVDREQAALNQLQDQARKMGYGSSVYDPN